MTATALSPAAAAKAASVSRSAIMRAISSKELKARRDNRNRWQIDRVDLDAWSANRPEQNRTVQSSDRTVTETVPLMFEQLSEARSDLAVAKAQIKGLEARLSDTQIERDHWRELATKGLLQRIRAAFKL